MSEVEVEGDWRLYWIKVRGQKIGWIGFGNDCGTEEDRFVNIVIQPEFLQSQFEITEVSHTNLQTSIHLAKKGKEE